MNKFIISFSSHRKDLIGAYARLFYFLTKPSGVSDPCNTYPSYFKPSFNISTQYKPYCVVLDRLNRVIYLPPYIVSAGQIPNCEIFDYLFFIDDTAKSDDLSPNFFVFLFFAICFEQYTPCQRQNK